MSEMTVQALGLGAILFAIGLVGFLTRRNLILMFLSLELMLAGVSTNFIAFGAHYGNFRGQLFAILILTVASCEAALALALVVALYRRNPTLDVWSWSSLREAKTEMYTDPAGTPTEEAGSPEELPHLTPAGRDPLVNPMPARFDADEVSYKA
ncbi:MAG: NADH-quinone oxidoreductase subunit NuoK [Pirellulales bacterium]